MPGRFENHIVKWAEGSGNNLAKSRNRAEGWGTLKKMLSKPFVTPEFRKQFDAMSKDEQDKLKAINGWICGAQAANGKRNKANLQPRDLLTIDVDYAPAHFLDLLETGAHGLGQYEAFWHSSRRHTLEAPRVRLFMPLTRQVSSDEYIALSRYAGWLLDHSMKLVDYVSYRPAQMMFKPSCSKDDEKIYFKLEQFGKLFDPDAMLKAFDKQFGSWMDLNCMPQSPDEENLRKAADKAEDPRGKNGPVGVFCRTYDIYSAMDEFLPGKYIPGDEHSGHPRFTYAGSTSSNGAIIYDDGLFMFSHHGHDPVGDMLVNAFDLVRIHLYGDLDEKAQEGTTPASMPSYKALIEKLKTDKKFQGTKRTERYSNIAGAFTDTEEDTDDEAEHAEPESESVRPDVRDEEDLDTAAERSVPPSGGTEPGTKPDDLHAAFDDLEGDDGGVRPEEPAERSAGGNQTRPRPKPSSQRKAKKDWLKNQIEYSLETAKILNTLHNAATIYQNDSRTRKVIRFNDFVKKVVVASDFDTLLPTFMPVKVEDKINGDKWQDHHETLARAILDAPIGDDTNGYGLQASKLNITDAIVMTARSNAFHPVKDYILNLKWDGRPRVDSMLIRYLKCPNTEYHRQISRLMLVASVTRVFEPGHKFDFAVIIQGPQGVRKSTLIQTLYGEKWFGELHVDLGEQQRVAEAVMGKWGVELPELGSLHKSDHNKAKAFMRQQRDDVRLAYEKNSADLPRQFICWGTTNDKKYLRDPTGNRSFWPCIMGTMTAIDTDSLAAERDQLWAEAFEIYWTMRDKQPHGTLPLYLQGAEANAEAVELQESARTEELHEIWATAIKDWLDKPVRLSQLYQEITGHQKPDAPFSDGEMQDPLVLRTVFTREQAVHHAIGKQHGIVADHSSTQNIGKALDLIPGWRAPKADAGATRRYIFGQRHRWIENTAADAADRGRGYSVVEEDNDVI